VLSADVHHHQNQHIPMKPKITNELLDELLKNYSQPGDLLGPEGLLTELKKRLINRVLDSELTTHLGYDKHQSPPESDATVPINARNGHSSKTLRSDDGKIAIKVPRDRNGDFEPTLVPKHKREFDGFDECIVSLYSRGLSVREIQQHLLEIYKVEVSSALITNATDAVIEEVKAWQNRALETVYPIVYFDAIVVKIRHEGKVTNRAIYLALAINPILEAAQIADIGVAHIVQRLQHQRGTPAGCAIGNNGLGAIEIRIMQRGSRISAEFHETARNCQRARHLAGSRDFGRFAHIQKNHISAAEQALRFICADARHYRFGRGEHLLDGEGHGSSLPE
jgi:hypothetical protein